MEGLDGSGKFENTVATNFFFQKYILLRNFKSLLSISLIFLGYFAYRFEFDQTIPERDGVYYYILVSICTLLMIILQIVELKILEARNNSKKLLKDITGYETNVYVIYSIISLIHPNNLFFRQKWIDEQTYNGEPTIRTFRRNFNEYLYLFQVTWLYLNFLKTFLVNTVWYSNHTDRVVRLIGFRMNDLFVIKCLMRDSQKITVLVTLFSTLMYYMIVLSVVESPLYYIDFIDSGFKNFVFPTIALWNSMITIFTVGYGDIYVVTYFGRFFVALLCIYSGIILSFFTVAITTDFLFEEQDQ